MASGPETHWPLPREDISLARDVSGSGVNHFISLEAKNKAEDGTTSSVDSLEQCYGDGCIAVATTAKEQISDILERGSWSPSRQGSFLMETTSKGVTSKDSPADQMEGYREGKCKQRISSVPKAASQPNLAHSESVPSAWKEKRETVRMCSSNDSSVSDELQEVICCMP